MPLSEVGESISWVEACDLVDQMGRRPGTHYWSALHGFTAPTTYQELATVLHAQGFLNRYRPEGSDPVRLPMPFLDSAQDAGVTPEERDELVEYARATAPFSLDD